MGFNRPYKPTSHEELDAFAKAAQKVPGYMDRLGLMPRDWAQEYKCEFPANPEPQPAPQQRKPYTWGDLLSAPHYMPYTSPELRPKKKAPAPAVKLFCPMCQVEPSRPNINALGWHTVCGSPVRGWKK